eukprot:GAHX01001980.1.p1 GENE.GAHX01001980.1~~GAHX01001980.1.p1  ORF type:complete len:317 (+),score=58.38 GAHX01001980.1:112-1062(+)
MKMSFTILGIFTYLLSSSLSSSHFICVYSHNSLNNAQYLSGSIDHRISQISNTIEFKNLNLFKTNILDSSIPRFLNTFAQVQKGILAHPIKHEQFLHIIIFKGIKHPNTLTELKKYIHIIKNNELLHKLNFDDYTFVPESEIESLTKHGFFDTNDYKAQTNKGVDLQQIRHELSKRMRYFVNNLNYSPNDDYDREKGVIELLKQFHIWYKDKTKDIFNTSVKNFFKENYKTLGVTFNDWKVYEQTRKMSRTKLVKKESFGIKKKIKKNKNFLKQIIIKELDEIDEEKGSGELLMDSECEFINDDISMNLDRFTIMK